MNEEMFDLAIPILIVVVFVNFVWAWILTAVTPPQGPDPALRGTGDPDWRAFDAGPPGVRKPLMGKIKPKIKAV